MKKIFLYPLSLLIWIFWWTNAIISMSLLFIITIFVPKKAYNPLVKIVCIILTYSAFIFPRHKGLKPEEIPFPVIYVANHVTFFDLFISGSILPGHPRGLELKSHFSKPIYGWFITKFGQIPIEIGSRASLRNSLVEAIERLKSKERSLFIMPEGQRTKDGKIGFFKSGAFYFSRKSGIPIVPVIYKDLYKLKNRNAYILIKPGFFDVIMMAPVYPDKFKTNNEMAKHIKQLMIKELEK